MIRSLNTPRKINFNHLNDFKILVTDLKRALVTKRIYILNGVFS